MRTRTIRVPAEIRDRLNALARRRGTTTGELVAELVRDAYEDSLLDEAARGWARLDLATYRAESGELKAFESPQPPY